MACATPPRGHGRPRYPPRMRFGGALRVGRLAGIELRISSTWLIIAALVVYSLAWSVLILAIVVWSFLISENFSQL